MLFISDDHDGVHPCSGVRCSTCFNVLTLNLQLDIPWLLLPPARKANERKYNSFHIQDRVPVGWGGGCPWALHHGISLTPSFLPKPTCTVFGGMSEAFLLGAEVSRGIPGFPLRVSVCLSVLQSRLSDGRHLRPRELSRLQALCFSACCLLAPYDLLV